MWSTPKAFHIFPQKKGNVFADNMFGNGNIMLTNDIDIFEQLNPDYLI